MNLNFRQLWLTHQLSSLTETVQIFGVTWIATTLGNSDSVVALVQTAIALPIVLLSLVCGAIADIYNHRVIMIIGKLLILISSTIITILIFLAKINSYKLILCVFTMSIGSTLYLQSWQSTTRHLVNEDNLQDIIILNSLLLNINKSISPFLSGLMLVYIGPIMPFFLNIIGSIISIMILLKYKSKYYQSRDSSLFSTIKIGLSFFSKNINLRRAIYHSFLFGIGSSSFNALTPVFIKNHLHEGASVYSLVFFCFGLGSFITASFFGKTHKILPFNHVLTISFSGYILGIIIIVKSSNPTILSLGASLAGAFYIINFNSLKIAIQLISPLRLSGRAFSIFRTIIFLGIAFGSIIWGTVSDAFGVINSFWASILFLLIGMIISIILPVKMSLSR